MSRSARSVEKPRRDGPQRPAPLRNGARSPGVLLDHELRRSFEAGFGHDFSRVRVHTGARAAESAESLGAEAYTVGQDLVFADGRYAPETPEGEWLLAHELAHVVQRGDAVTAPDRPVSRPGEPAEAEADRAAERVVAGEAAGIGAGAGEGGAAVQCYIPGLLENLPSWEDVTGWAGSAIGSGASALGSGIADAGAWGGGMSSSAGSGAGRLIGSAGSGLGGLVGQGAGVAGQGLSGLGKLIYGAGSPGAQIGGIFGNAIAQSGSVLGSSIQGRGSSLAGGAAATGGTLGSMLAGGTGAIGGGISGAGSAIGDFVSGLGGLEPSRWLL